VIANVQQPEQKQHLWQWERRVPLISARPVPVLYLSQ
jgi:hypothetical protein